MFTHYFDIQSRYWAVDSKFYKLLLDAFHNDYKETYALKKKTHLVEKYIASTFLVYCKAKKHIVSKVSEQKQ